MTAIDDLSTVGDEYSFKAYISSSAEERIGYLYGKLDTQQAFFREQMAEWKSKVDPMEYENRTWKATVQQNQEQVAALHEQMTELKSHVLTSKKLLEHDDNNNDSKNLLVTNKAASSSTKRAPALFREQIDESKSSEARLEHEILALKTAIDQMAQEKVELSALLGEQIAESKSSEARSKHEILTLKTTMEQMMVQEKEDLVARFHDQITDLKANVLAKLEEENLSFKAVNVEQQVARHDNNPQTESLSHYVASIEQRKLVLAATNLQSESSPGGSPTTMLPKTAPVYVWQSSASSISTGRSGDYMIDVLDFPGVPPGTTCTWNIKILRGGDGLRLGVVTSALHNLKLNLGESSYSWGYGRRGDVWHKCRRIDRKQRDGFGTGSIVTFRLEGENISVSVDGKPMVQVFQGMGPGYFVPAVFLFNACSIEFLGFQG
jgi:hypothetical protein